MHGLALLHRADDRLAGLQAAAFAGEADMLGIRLRARLADLGPRSVQELWLLALLGWSRARRLLGFGLRLRLRFGCWLLRQSVRSGYDPGGPRHRHHNEQPVEHRRCK